MKKKGHVVRVGDELYQYVTDNKENEETFNNTLYRLLRRKIKLREKDKK